MTLDDGEGGCPNPDALLELAAGQLEPVEVECILSHLSECRACRAAVAAAEISTKPRSVTSDRTQKAREPAAALDALTRGLQRFLPIEVIASGGMGVVFRAYDPKLSREVAIKTLRPDREPSATTELLAEARAMARVSDANIVQVYDVEVTATNAVLIVMEFIDGPTLRHWQREEQRSPGELLDMYSGAARGLVAAHARGLHHGDFKPSNVLIAPGGVPKVTDFGLARAEAPRDVSEISVVSRTSATTTVEAIMGTPRYMSPEQHAGLRITAASDQFSFCVALWEALVGASPFSPTQLEQSKEAGPPPWTECGVDPRIGDILRRGLSPDPDDRWPNLEALLSALRAARAPKQWRRTLSAGAGVGALALAFLLTSRDDSPACADPRLMHDIWDESTRDALAGAFDQSEVPYARDSWSFVSHELDAYARRWMDEHEAVCRSNGDRTDVRMSSDARLVCLARSRTALRSSVRVLSDADPQTLEKAYEIVTALPRPESCVDAHMRSTATTPDDDETEAVETIRADLATASSLRVAARYDDAQAALDRAKSGLSNLRFEPVQIEVSLEEGHLLTIAGDYEGARERLADGFARAVRLGVVELAFDAALTMSRTVGIGVGHVDEAEAYARVATELSTNEIERAVVMTLSGDLARHAGRLDDAEASHQAALSELAERLAPTDLRVINARSGLAEVLHDMGRFEDAEHSNRELLATLLPIVGPNHPQIATLRIDLGTALRNQGRLDEAEEELVRAVQIRRASLGPNHSLVALAMNNLGGVFLKRGELDSAEAEYRAALQISLESLGEDHELTIGLHTNLGALAYQRKDFEAAELQMRATLEPSIRTMGKDHPRVGLIRQNIAGILNQLGRDEAAAEEYELALAIRVRALGAGHEKVAMTRSNYAMTLLGLGRYEDARAQAAEAWRIRKDATLQPSQKASTASVLARATYLADPTSAAKARELAELSRSLYQRGSGDHASDLAQVDAFIRSLP